MSDLRWRRSAALALLGLTPTLAAAEEGGACRAAAWSGPRPGSNVILIVNDTWRRDRVGAYGGPAETPAFDRFASENLRFEHAYSQSPWTSPSVATLFTSLYPSQHGVTSHPEANEAGGGPREVGRVDRLPASAVTLAEVLHGAGYRTAALVGNPWLEPRFGFAQGFETYDISFAGWEVQGGAISRAALGWLEHRKKDAPFFLYLHYMDSHRPYVLLDPEEIIARKEEWSADGRSLSGRAGQLAAKVTGVSPGSAAYAAGVRPTVGLVEATYDRGVEQFDRALGELLDALAHDPSFPRTAILVTSDHGESLFERGFGNHGRSLYDDEIAVPLAARLPGVQPGVVDCALGLIDILPSLCSYLGIECPDPVYGVNHLAGEGGARTADRLLIAEGVMEKPWNRSLRTGRWKLLWQPDRGPDGSENLLFDMQADPGETRDLLDWERRTPESSKVFSSLVKTMNRAVPEYSLPDGEELPLTPEERKRLKALGYGGN